MTKTKKLVKRMMHQVHRRVWVAFHW